MKNKKYVIGRYDYDGTPGFRDSGKSHYKGIFETKEGVRKYICNIDHIKDIETLIGSRGEQIIGYHSKEDCELIKSGKVEGVEEILNTGGQLGYDKCGYNKYTYYLFLSEEEGEKGYNKGGCS